MCEVGSIRWHRNEGPPDESHSSLRGLLGIGRNPPPYRGELQHGVFQRCESCRVRTAPVAELIRSFCREQSKNLDGRACEDMNMGVDALSSAAPAKTATQNRNRSSKFSAESPCRPRGVPLPSSFRMTSERLN